MKKIFFIAIIVMLGGIGSLFGQESTAVSADKSLRSNARINPSTLAMEMEIPLASYPGRGISVPVSISYSSKLWRMEDAGTHPIINLPPQSHCWKVGNPKFAELSASGWTASTAVPYIEYVGYDNLYSELGFPISDDIYEGLCSGGSHNSINYVRRIVVHMPGGGTHELRADDTVISYPTDAPANHPSRVENQANWNTTYYAVDGSNLIYVEDSTTGTYRLKLTDGSQIDFASSRQTVQWSNTHRTTRMAVATKDANGNTITYGSGSQTDTMGRTIPEPFGLTAPTSPTTTNYNLPGFGTSGTIAYKLYWKKLKDTTAAESALTDFNDTLCYPGGGLIYPGNPQPPPGSCYLFNTNGFGRVVSVPVAEFNPVVMKTLELPDGRTYEFGYDVYGRINKITYPTGAYETFNYSAIPLLNLMDPRADDIYTQVNHGVTSRSVYESTGAAPIPWTYSVETTDGYKVRTVAPDGTKNDRYLNRGNPIIIEPQPTNGNFGFDTPLVGMPYEERSYTSADTLISKKITTWSLTELPINAAAPPPSHITADWHPRVTREESIVYDTSTGAALSASTTTEYDGDLSQRTTALNPKTVTQYGFTTNIGSLGTLEKYTEIDYVADSNYAARNLRSLPLETRVKDAVGNVKAKSQIFYDEVGTYPLLTDVSSTRWEDPNTNYRGLVTTTKSWSDIANNLFVTTHAQYDRLGNARKSWDGNGNLSQVEYSSTYDHAYPTKTISPDPDGAGAITPLETTVVYDYNTGLPTSTTDANGQTTQMQYNDPLLRPTKTIAPNGHQTITEYGAGTSELTRFVKSRSQIDETNWKEAYSWFDGLGRAYKSQSIDSAGDVFTETLFDEFGRPWKTSNPYRSGETKLWTENFYDTAGRVWKVKTPDGADVETAYGLATTGTQIGTAVTVTDQTEKQRRSITNALGQLTRVDEPNNAGQLGTVASPNQPTLYAYDTLNNLTTVNQGVQTRTFSYNSLSRLLSATNPESGTINYGYDPNGNLTTKTDARGVKTDYIYDALSRVTNRNYSTPGGTPPNYRATPNVTYFYDNLPNAKGKLTKVASSVSTTEYTSFDILGRVTAHKQTTEGGDPNGYTTGYIYNLSGAMIEETYPSGRVAKNVLDDNGDLSIVQSKKNATSGYWNYAKNFTYNSAGAATSLQLGNGKWESTTFNSRLQSTQIALGTVQNGTDKLKLEYGYGTTANNGNVLSQKITVKRQSQSDLVFDQTYTYDSLNRITSAEEKTGATVNWNQTYTFDRYGNRNFNEALTTTLPKNCGTSPNFVVCTADIPVFNPSVNTGNNRLNGTVYDAAGNVIVDAEGRQFTYDAENKQIEVENSSQVVIGTYFFDGEGKRVKKVVPSTGEVTIFVYDAGSKLVAEYSTIVEPVETAKVQYLTADNLGTPRINTDRDGNIVSRSDYMPYGEEIIGLGNRTSADKYAADTVRQGFTGYQNDIETGLDFAQARVYSKQTGRFTSSDPLLTTGRPTMPKTWNRYVYTLNNPLNFVDPSGMYECFGSKNCDSDNDRKFEKQLRNAKKHLEKIGKKYGLNSETYVNAKRGLDAYGAKGEVNGITVKFGATEEGKATAGGLIDGSKKTITVTFDLNQLKDDGDFQAAIGHEGSHAQDRSDLAGAMLGAINGDFKFENAATLKSYQEVIDNDTLNLTSRQTESKAYGVTSVIAEYSLKSHQNLSLGDSGVLIAGDPAWANLDKTKLVSERSAAIADGLSKDTKYSKRADVRFIPR